MAEYLSPGVYVEEFSSGIKPMEGVSTSTVGFVGMTQRGKVRGVPEFVSSFGEFQRIFGGYLPVSYGDRRYLPMAVEQFFANGGSRCFVARLLNEEGTACARVKIGTVTFTAASPGVWGNSMFIMCRKSMVKDNLYNIVVASGRTESDYAENYADLSLDPKDKNFIVSAMEKSLLVNVECVGESKDFYLQFLEAELAQASDPKRVAAIKKARGLYLAKDPAWEAEAREWKKSGKADTSDSALKALLAAVEEPAEEEKALLDALQAACATEPDAEKAKASRDAALAAEKAALTALQAKAGRTPEEEALLGAMTQRAADAAYAADAAALAELRAKEELTDDKKASIEEMEKKLADAGAEKAHGELLRDAAACLDLKEPQDEDNLAVGPLLAGGLDGAPVGEEPADAAALVNAAVIKGSDGGPGQRTGLFALEDIPEVSIVVAPGVTENAEVQEIITHCEKMKNRVCILDMPEKLNKVTELQTHRQQFTSSFAAIYHPWIQVFDPLQSKSAYMPPSGAMAGIYARTDNTRGVFKAPANEVIRNCTGLETLFGKAEQDMLNPLGVNLIRNIQGLGIRVWGARTLSDDSQWKYINVRRLFIYIEETIRRNTAWAVFEPNDQLLWTKVRGSIVSFLGTLWRDGALFGASESEAYFVNIGKGSTMTDDDILNGRMICVIGVAPVRPAEFVIFRITQIMEQNG